MTQADVARALSVTQPYIAQLEGNLVQPSDDKLHALALLTGFSAAFFRQSTPPDFPIGSLLYRSRASTTSAERVYAHRYAQLSYELASGWANKLVDLPVLIPRVNPDVENTDEPLTPAHAAQITRAALRLSPNTPIENLIRTLEAAGVFVLAVPSNLERIDAFSMWVNSEKERPIIVIASNFPGDRMRMTVAHELGHLVMHQAPTGTIKQIEQDAFKFASELLLPEEAMREEIEFPVVLGTIAKLKPRWRVSIQALVMRAHDLGIVTDYQYHYLFEQIGAFGWKTREPASLDIPEEKPRFIRQVAELQYKRPLDYQRIATDTLLPVSLVQEILESQAGGERQSEQGRLDDTDPEPTNVVHFTPRK